jgi:predicted nucleotidyltransferase
MAEFPITDPGNLLQRVSEALRDLPGAYELYVFGSLADGKFDAYSDIDLDAEFRDGKASMPFGRWDFSTPAAMDNEFCDLLEQTIALAREKAKYMDEDIPLDLVKSLMKFIRAELG